MFGICFFFIVECRCVVVVVCTTHIDLLAWNCVGLSAMKIIMYRGKMGLMYAPNKSFHSSIKKKRGEKGAVCVYNVQMEDEDISTS